MTETQQLNQFLTQQGMDYKQLASRLSFHRSYTWKVTTGKEPVSTGFRYRFAAVFGQDVAKTVFNGDCQVSA